MRRMKYLKIRCEDAKTAHGQRFEDLFLQGFQSSTQQGNTTARCIHLWPTVKIPGFH